ncbi:maleylacetoacetate isomerase [Sphingomonas lacunae]|uniref:Maleylacetoacetate isomerase n=1 Tax=Sphingomonas lacunae TaxID=2698828 RepID=A0A6M4AZ44_9SPHN|nr:maleylacetoacetate isomerase [Sphingomonas lacunae]QJQ33339.1 maleylacetoacetate isomerase [Sphingomonas lacunae]
MTDPVLHDYFRSSASYRVRIALNLKGVNYHSVPTSLLAGDQRSDAYLALNPQGLVPALEVDGLVFTQSFAIIDWLDRTYPEPRLIPEDPVERAGALAMTMAIACDIHPLNNLRVLKYLTHDLGLRDEVRDRWYIHWVVEGLTALEAMAQGAGPFLGGDTPNIADIFLVPQLANARRYDISLASFPTLATCEANALGLEAFAAAAPERVKPQD